MEFILITLLNGLSYGLLLFMLSSGLTLIFSMMGVLNFAHASFYMLGAYLTYALSMSLGFWTALCIAPPLVGTLGALIERYGLRRVHVYGHISELLFTFGLAYVLLECVQLIWGRAAVPYRIPAELDRPLFTLYSTTFPAYRGFIMLVALSMLVALYALLKGTRVGLIIQAALTHPQAVEALGHDVPSVLSWVFGGGCALAALAGVVGGSAFVTEPGMAATMGSIVFVVVVVGGMGSLLGAFLASLLIGVMQTFAVALDYSLLHLLRFLGVAAHAPPGATLLTLKIADLAPILPYLLLILVLLFRPQGLLGRKENE